MSTMVETRASDSSVASQYAVETAKSHLIMDTVCGNVSAFVNGNLSVTAGFDVRIKCRTMKNDVVQRLNDAIKRSGKSDRDVSLTAGMSADVVRGVKRNKSPTVETIRKIAGALDVSPEWLAFGVGETSLHDGREGYVPIRGEVAAGMWIDASENHWSDEVEVAPIAFTPEWPRESQFGLRVRGTSINRRANDGDILRCIDLAASGIEPLDGDLVIVQRERDDGLREVTAKIIHRDGKVIRLEPDSTDERHKAIILDGKKPADGVVARIVAVVDLILRPMRKFR